MKYGWKIAVNTQYMRNPDMVYLLKMEYVPKINIFGLNMMVKSGLEKIFLKFLHAQGLFQVCPVGCLSLVLLNRGGLKKALRMEEFQKYFF